MSADLDNRSIEGTSNSNATQHNQAYVVQESSQHMTLYDINAGDINKLKKTLSGNESSNRWLTSLSRLAPLTSALYLCPSDVVRTSQHVQG